jgi:hypothetical protein
LETASLIEKLPDFLGVANTDTQIDTQGTGASRPDVTQAVTVNNGVEVSKAVANKGDCHAMASAVAVCHGGQLNSELGFESPSLRHKFV